MVKVFPLFPLEQIARKAGAERVSREALIALRDSLLEISDKIASDSVAIARHAGRVTVKGEDIKIAVR
ncbi:MAG TPA: histone [archaeon]|nr:histone [archaeon]